MDDRNDLPNLGNDDNSISAEDTLHQFWGTAKDVIARYSHCTLCGANLHFSHVTNFAKNITQEIAKCPECGLKVRQVVHRLQ